MMMHSYGVLLKHVANSRYHVLLEMYNESLEEPKEVSGIRIIIIASNVALLIVIATTIPITIVIIIASTLISGKR